MKSVGVGGCIRYVSIRHRNGGGRLDGGAAKGDGGGSGGGIDGLEAALEPLLRWGEGEALTRCREGVIILVESPGLVTGAHFQGLSWVLYVGGRQMGSFVQSASRVMRDFATATDGLTAPSVGVGVKVVKRTARAGWTRCSLTRRCWVTWTSGL